VNDLLLVLLVGLLLLDL